MKFRIAFIFFFALLASLSFSQGRFIKFMEGNYDAHPTYMLNTNDGGFLFTGYYDSLSFINSSAFVIKTDASGNIQWTKKFTTGYNTRAISACQLIDQSIVVCGKQTSSDGNSEGMMALKFDAAGNFIFNQVYDGIYGEDAQSIAACSDGGFILCGSTFSFGSGSQILISKCDAAGNMQWTSHYGNTTNEYANHIIQTTDGGFLVTGETDIMGGGTDGYVLKLTSTGALSWAKVIGISSQISLAKGIQTQDGNYLMVGKKMNGSNPEATLIKLDVNGNLLWANLNTGTNKSEACCVKELNSGDILVGGTCNPSSANLTWLAKINSGGSYQWQHYINIASTFSNKCVGLSGNATQVYSGSISRVNNRFGFLFSVHDVAGVNCATVSQGITSYTYTPAINNFGSVTTCTLSTFNGGAFSSGVQSSLYCNGCGLTIQLNPSDSTICSGTSVNFSASVSGPGAPYSYQWSHGGGNLGNPVFNPISTTIYTLTVTTSAACSQQATQKIYVGPVDSVSSNPTLCAGYSTILSGYGFGTYSWNTGSTATSVTVAPAQTTIYTVTINNGAYGCSKSYPITVNVNNCPSVPAFCNSVAIGAAAWGFDIIPTQDGNYFATGYGMGTNVDACLAKIDRNGNIIWSQSFGNPNTGANAEAVHKVIETSKGNYVGVSTVLNSSNTEYDAIIVCYDRIGNLLWRRVVDYFTDSYFSCVLETPDGGFLATSNNSGNTAPTLVRFDSLGNLKYIRALNHSTCTSINYNIDKIAHTNGGYLLAGQTECTGAGLLDFYIMKMDTAGNVLWHKTIGTPGNEYFYDFTECSDGGIVLCGMKEETSPNGGNAYIAKLDASGNIAWTKVIGITALNYQDYFFTVTERSGHLIFGGALYNTTTTFYQPWLMATDLSGNILWNHASPSQNYLNNIHRVAANTDGSIIALGIYQNNTDGYHRWLLNKYDFGGNSCCTQNALTNITYSAGTVNSSTGFSTAYTSAATTIAYTPVNFLPFAFNDCQSAVGIEGNVFSSKLSNYVLYPNPSNINDVFYVKGENVRDVKVYSIVGYEIPVILNNTQEDVYELKLNVESGIYLIQISNGLNTETLKFIVK